MSTVQYLPKPTKPLNMAIDYAFKCEKDGAPVFCEGVSQNPKDAYIDMRSVQKTYDYKGKQQYRSIIYSFSESEAQRLSTEQMLDIGSTFAKRAFVGHSFVMGMHNDTKNPHFHIHYNIVHPETGKLIQNKLDVKRLRSLNDQVLMEKGIKPLKEYDKSKLSSDEKIKAKEEYRLTSQRVKYNNIRYVRDLKQKAHSALSISTNFNEYAAALDSFDIKVRVENKNITYFYPDKQKGIRGKYLSDELDKKGLINGFESNLKRFKEDSFLRGLAQDQFDEHKNSKGGHREQQEELENFTSGARRHSRYHSPLESELSSMLVPQSEIIKAKKQSLPDYLKKHKVKTILNEKGQTVLKGREHVVINESSWVNTKNKTQGNIIDFVVIHHGVSYLESLARLNNNPRLKLLSKELNQGSFTYQSFHVPKEKRANYDFALSKVSNLLKSKGVDSGLSKRLMETRKVQVDLKGDIHFLDDDDKRGSFVFSQEENNKWKSKPKGNPTGIFFKTQKKSSKVVVFDSPFSFLNRDQSFKSYESSKDSILVLMNKDRRVIDRFLAENDHINEVSIYSDKKGQQNKGDFLFLRKLRKRLSPFSINVSTTNEVEKGRSRSLEIDR